MEELVYHTSINMTSALPTSAVGAGVMVKVTTPTATAATMVLCC